MRERCLDFKKIVTMVTGGDSPWSKQTRLGLLFVVINVEKNLFYEGKW